MDFRKLNNFENSNNEEELISIDDNIPSITITDPLLKAEIEGVVISSDLAEEESHDGQVIEMRSKPLKVCNLSVKTRIMEDRSRRKRLSYHQLEGLWKFLDAHRECASGFNKTTESRDHSRRMWSAVAEELNSYEGGAVKNWKEWSKYWIDFKGKLKKRVSAVHRARDADEGSSDAPSLTDLELKFITLLGDNFGTASTHRQPDTISKLPQDTKTSEPIPVHTVPPIAAAVVKEEVMEIPQYKSPQLEQSYSRSAQMRRRRRKAPIMTQEAARNNLIELSRSRLEVDKRNNQLLQEISSALNRIADALTSRVPETRNGTASGS